MKYDLAFKRKEVLQSAKTWINLEDIMLSKISQSQKDKRCMLPFTWGTESSQSHRDKK